MIVTKVEHSFTYFNIHLNFLFWESENTLELKQNFDLKSQLLSLQMRNLFGCGHLPSFLLKQGQTHQGSILLQKLFGWQ